LEKKCVNNVAKRQISPYVNHVGWVYLLKRVGMRVAAKNVDVL